MEPAMTLRTHSTHPYTDNPAALAEAWAVANLDKKMRARDAAEFLDVSECELVASLVGTVATRLNCDWVNILQRVKSIGRVMALTRNDAVVHERKGVYLDTSAQGAMGLVLGDDIDLRLFFSNWHYGYALTEMDGAITKRSIQFFDDAGDAVHKIFLQAESDVDEFEMVVEQFRADNQAPGERVNVRKPPAVLPPNTTVDVIQFRAAWANLQDTHEFFGLLKKFSVPRTQAFRLAEPQFAYEVSLNAAREMLHAAALAKAEIMCFVAHIGCIQIHTGAVSNIQVMGPWLNVLDPDFNLHLREDMIHEAWVVKKPTADGIITSLELFDRYGVQLVQFFGKRKPGQPEREDWREIVRMLIVATANVAAAPITATDSLVAA
jgi:putative hemin transport protein